MEKFAIGLLLGCVGGALLTANNYKMRTLVKKSQEEVQAKFDAMLDEKIREMDMMSDENEAEDETESEPKKSAKDRRTAKRKATPAKENA